MNIRYRQNERAGRCPMCLRPSERKIWGVFVSFLGGAIDLCCRLKFYASSDQFHSDLCPAMNCSAPQVEKEKKETGSFAGSVPNNKKRKKKRQTSQDSPLWLCLRPGVPACSSSERQPRFQPKPPPTPARCENTDVVKGGSTAGSRRRWGGAV